MNLFVNGILLMALLAALLMPASEAAVAYGVFKHDKYPGKCYVTSKIILNPGGVSTKTNAGCGRVICRNNSEVQIETCVVIASVIGCKWGKPVYPEADYPNCCLRGCKIF